MRRLLKFLPAFIVLVLMAVSPVQAQNQSDAQYRLAAGDVIRVTVFGEPQLSFDEIRLTDAGTLSYPFIGEVRANGLTARELEQVLVEALQGDFLVDPRVTISVLSYREFFISGEVKSPGSYPYQPGLTLRRAVALAGGLTERASVRRITIIRDSDPESKEQRATLETELRPGDTITIGQGFF